MGFDGVGVTHGMLEGRADTKVHKQITAVLEPKVFEMFHASLARTLRADKREMRSNFNAAERAAAAALFKDDKSTPDIDERQQRIDEVMTAIVDCARVQMEVREI